jgi:plasmid stabilization system protein ParE
MDSVRHADLVEAAILETCRLAANNPEVEHVRPDVSDREILFLSVRAYTNYVVAFRRGSRSLRVLRVLHGAQNVKEIFRAE